METITSNTVCLPPKQAKEAEHRASRMAVFKHRMCPWARAVTNGTGLSHAVVYQLWIAGGTVKF